MATNEKRGGVATLSISISVKALTNYKSEASSMSPTKTNLITINVLQSFLISVRMEGVDSAIIHDCLVRWSARPDRLDGKKVRRAGMGQASAAAKKWASSRRDGRQEGRMAGRQAYVISLTKEEGECVMSGARGRK